MGFNYRQRKKEFEKTWAKALKQYMEAGMTQEQIAAMREFEETLFRQDRTYENRVDIGLPDLNIRRFSVEENYYDDLSNHLDTVLDNLRAGSSKQVTQQDKQILLLAASGLNQQEIAVKLHINQSTVSYHINKLKKLLKTVQ